MKSIIESIQGGNSIKDLKTRIINMVDMRDFPYIREMARNYKSRLQNPKFLSALDAISGCDNEFKADAVYDMMGYIEAQYDINYGEDDWDVDAMDQGAWDMIEMMSDPQQNQNDFQAFLGRSGHDGDPAWTGLSKQYAKIAKLFMNSNFELM